MNLRHRAVDPPLRAHRSPLGNEFLARLLEAVVGFDFHHFQLFPKIEGGAREMNRHAARALKALDFLTAPRPFSRP
jgi:hypothetical protein